MKDKTNKLYNIDNIEFLKTLPDNSISSCISDVPYALCDIDALKMIKEDMQNKSDFMGRKWFLPSIEFLKECNRVLKDGGFFITTFSPRQDLQCVFSYRLLEAGFDINFTPILWCFQTGFPKAADFSKMADRRAKAEREVIGKNSYANRRPNGNQWAGDGELGGNITKPTTAEAQYLDGLKSLQLKPAYEVVIIAQKPYKAKSKIDQALVWYNERKELLDKGIKEEDLYLYTKNASGGVRIDKNEMFEGAMSSRIPCESDDNCRRPSGYGIFSNSKIITGSSASEGKFPATILVENNCLDVGRETKESGKDINIQAKSMFQNGGVSIPRPNDQGDLSRYFSLDAWTKKNIPELYKISKKTLELQEDAEKISPFLFTSKADKGSKNAGLEGFESQKSRTSMSIARGYCKHTNQVYEKCQCGNCDIEYLNNETNTTQNTHPTGKPISLYSYLINLFTHPHDLVLDPYCGSGTTPIACVLTNRHYIGLELEKEYFDIAEARVKHWQEQKECQKNKTSKEEGTLI